MKRQPRASPIRWNDQRGAGLTLPLETGSLAEWLNTGKENGSDEGNESALHAGVQAGSGQAGQGWPEHGGDGEDPGHCFQPPPDDRLGPHGSSCAASVAQCPEQMEIARLRAELARVKMERDILGKATAYFAKERG